MYTHTSSISNYNIIKSINIITRKQSNDINNSHTSNKITLTKSITSNTIS